MELQKILEYQKIDSKIYAFELELKQSKVAMDYAKAMSMHKSCTEDMLKSIRDADEIAILVDRYRQTYQKIYEEISGLNDVLESFEELKEIDRYEKKNIQYQKELLNVEHELTKLAKKMDECIKVSESSLDKIVKLEGIIKKNKEDLQKLKQGMQAEVSELMKQLKVLSADIPAQLLTKYNEIRKNKKMPVLVPCTDDFTACNGCGMDIPNNLSSKLKDKEIVECPNCGRLLYNDK